MQGKVGFIAFANRKKMRKKITHAGVIESIEGRHVRVRIIQQAACASCKVASHCNASDMKEKVVDVFTDDHCLTTGQQVIISTSDKAVKQALILGFVLPLALLMCILLLCEGVGMAEDTSALLAIGVLIPYYIIIWFFREKIAQNISFQIEG